MQNSFPLTYGSSKESLQLKWLIKRILKKSVHRMPLYYAISAILVCIRFYKITELLRARSLVDSCV